MNWLPCLQRLSSRLVIPVIVYTEILIDAGRGYTRWQIARIRLNGVLRRRFLSILI